MNKLFLVISVLAIALIAYLLLAPNVASLPDGHTITNTVPQNLTEEHVDHQTAALAASMITTSPENAAVFITEPGDGQTVTSPVMVRFGITGMAIAPAGQNSTNSGHHHLLIDLEQLPSLDQPLPSSPQLVHFGQGQTETSIELDPGSHTLQLLLGNYLHIPHDPPVMSKKITIHVE